MITDITVDDKCAVNSIYKVEYGIIRSKINFNISYIDIENSKEIPYNTNYQSIMGSEYISISKNGDLIYATNAPKNLQFIIEIQIHIPSLGIQANQQIMIQYYYEWKNELISTNILVREAEMSIDNDDWQTNKTNGKIDVINFNQFGFSYDEMKSAGYFGFKIKLTMQKKETDDGYQRVGISDGQGGIYWTEHEQGGLWEVDKTYRVLEINHNHVVDNYWTNEIHIYYGSRGSGLNMW